MTSLHLYPDLQLQILYSHSVTTLQRHHDRDADYIHSSCVKGFTPELTVDIRTVEQGGQDALGGTHTAQHQADPIQ